MFIKLQISLLFVNVRDTTVNVFVQLKKKKKKKKTARFHSTNTIVKSKFHLIPSYINWTSAVTQYLCISLYYLKLNSI